MDAGSMYRNDAWVECEAVMPVKREGARVVEGIGSGTGC
jgi:hypothetical protein